MKARRTELGNGIVTFGEYRTLAVNGRGFGESSETIILNSATFAHEQSARGVFVLGSRLWDHIVWGHKMSPVTLE